MADSILFATPCYGGQVTAQHFRSCMLLKEELTTQGLPNDWLITWNESLVHRGRMEMVATFLATKHTHLFWLDADIEFEPADVAALWNLDADVAVGVYAMKKRDAQWFAAWKDGKLVKDLDQFKGPIHVDYAGTGFMLIRRQVIERLADSLKAARRVADALVHRIDSELALTFDERAVLNTMHAATMPDFEGAKGRVPALFTTPIHNDVLESEDYHFCRLAREAGFKITMDPSVRLKHWGQFAFGAG